MAEKSAIPIQWLEDLILRTLLAQANTPPSPDPFQNAIPRGSPLGVNAMEVARKDPLWEAVGALHEAGVPEDEQRRRFPNAPRGGPWGYPNTDLQIIRLLDALFRGGQ